MNPARDAGGAREFQIDDWHTWIRPHRRDRMPQAHRWEIERVLQPDSYSAASCHEGSAAGRDVRASRLSLTQFATPTGAPAKSRHLAASMNRLLP